MARESVNRRDSATASTVTVVISVWDDYVRFLPKAIGSVRQNDLDVEIVVIDNASTEPLPPVDGARVVRSPARMSVGAARNFGLDQVATDYVFMLDVDDELAPGALRFLRDRLDERPDLSVCALSLHETDTGSRHRLPRAFSFALAATRGQRLFAFLECVWPQFSACCAMMRMTDVAATLRYADADWSDDWALATSMAFRGRVELHRRIGLYYHPTEGSLWRRSRSSRELGRSTALIRERLRTDPVIPRWIRLSLPLIGVLQFAVVFVARPPYQLLKRVTGSKPFVATAE